MKYATIETNRGTMTAELYDTEAPGTVENFEKLANTGYYDGIKFHRVIPDFVVQGGEPLSRDLPEGDRRVGTGGPGYKIEDLRATAMRAASTEESISGRAASRFSHEFNERVKFTDTTEVVTSDTSTQISNSAALSASIMGNLSARVSLDVRHDTNPLVGFEPTDTATKFSLVYKVE
jgi:cyclophilin family peptidyl-prolyl cis-trans isomerase